MNWLDLVLVLGLSAALVFAYHFLQPYFVTRRPSGFSFSPQQVSDEALEKFIANLTVDQSTLEFHVALARLMRDKGEVQRAIRIRQHVLHSGILQADQAEQVRLELARDYYKAGFLDWSEQELLPLVADDTAVRREALLLLMAVYQAQKDWEKALDIADKLHKKRLRLPFITNYELGPDVVSLLNALAHFCCELAQEAADDDRIEDANNYISKAYDYDGSHVRAQLMQASAAVDEGDPKAALRILRRIIRRKPECLFLLEDLLRSIDSNESGYLRRDVVEIVALAHAHSPSVVSMRLLAELTGDIDLLHRELQRNPSMALLQSCLKLEPVGDDVLMMTRIAVDELTARQETYCCHHCGYKSKAYWWSCPTCRKWETMRLAV